jgi:hypothetical protein
MRTFDFDQSVEYNDLVKEYDKLESLVIYITKMQVNGEIDRLDTLSRATYLLEEKMMNIGKQINKIRK